jgi:hypothetical protein
MPRESRSRSDDAAFENLVQRLWTSARNASERRLDPACLREARIRWEANTRRRFGEGWFDDAERLESTFRCCRNAGERASKAASKKGETVVSPRTFMAEAERIEDVLMKLTAKERGILKQRGGICG